MTSVTGHDDFDRCKNKFSVTVRKMESALHKRVSDSDSSDSREDRELSQLIRKASTLLSAMSSMAKSVSETEDPTLQQELLDIYKACKMQLKTYKMLYAQTDLFQDSYTTTSTSSEKETSEREILFGARATTDDSAGHYGANGGASSRTKYMRDQVTSNTSGRIGQQNSRLQDALRSIRETDQVAQEISGELSSQRETMQSAQGRLGQFQSQLEHSNNLLNSMNKPWWRKW